MAQISFEQINAGTGTTSGATNNTSRIGYFSLKNDNDEAVVRIMHDSTADFEILTTHPITLNGKFLKANCLRTALEPIDNCPLCKAGEKVQQRIFVHLVQYTIENGQIVATPKVWDRPVSFATDLKSKLDMYGPLSEQLFVIKRHGAAGDMKTTYSIDYAPPIVYPYENYPKLVDAFKDYTAIGNAVVSRTKEDFEYFVANGNFPQKQQTEVAPQTMVPPTPSVPQQSTYTPSPSTVTVSPMQQPMTPMQQPVAQSQVEQPQMQRPPRYY